MTMELKSLWLLPALRGIIALLFAAVLFTHPALSVILIINIFGIFLFVFGLFTAIMSFIRRKTDVLWSNHIIDAAISMLIGLVIWLWPGLTGLVLIYIIAFWAIISGIIQFVTAIRLRHLMGNMMVGAIMGLLLVLVGITIVIHPASGLGAIAILIGIAAAIYGILSLIFSWQVWKAGR